MSLKVINYNIWNGFVGEENKTRYVNFINGEKPDVVAIQELCHFDKRKLQKLAEQYGHQYSVLLKNDGYPVGITASSEITLIKRQIKEYWHGFLHVTIKKVHYLVLHLSPGPHDYRLKELGQFSEYISAANLNVENCVIPGDFNSFSDRDAESSAVEEFDIIRGFEALGFMDSMRAVDYAFSASFPTALLPDSPAVPQRIDFQLVSSSLYPRIQRSEIINNVLTNGISDHYPLVVEYA